MDVDTGLNITAVFDSITGDLESIIPAPGADPNLVSALAHATQIEPDGSLGPPPAAPETLATGSGLVLTGGIITTVGSTTVQSDQPWLGPVNPAATGLNPAAATAFLATDHADALVFNLSTSGNQVLSVLLTIPSDFTGPILLLPSAATLTLPSLPHATFIQGQVPAAPAPTQPSNGVIDIGDLQIVTWSWGHPGATPPGDL